MKTIKILFSSLLLVGFLSSCVVIRPGEVGVRQRLGRINDAALSEGPRSYNPFTSTIITLPTRTVNLEIRSNLPSKEGLTISSDISILYRIMPNEAPNILRDIGRSYEQQIILPVFRSASADVTARFLAKDMHSGERSVIETQIRDRMSEILESKGIVVENVLLKSIQLPQGLSRSIEEKLQAEQDAQRMVFVKQQEQADAERRTIKAEGDRTAAVIDADAERQQLEIRAAGQANAILLEANAQAEANEKLAEALEPQILQYRAIEAFYRMSTSNNSKVIITSGDSPFLGIPAELVNKNN
ncbi:prohibitin family protein [Lewinella cohaerens]|uniref:prohibitin family protein n=1 Tax=Lewinella cohaerens TaxID=70995 RepID=UPI00037AB4D6|nr:prohibitin family protein [Lewinella cohaerens]